MSYRYMFNFTITCIFSFIQCDLNGVFASHLWVASHDESGAPKPIEVSALRLIITLYRDPVL